MSLYWLGTLVQDVTEYQTDNLGTLVRFRVIGDPRQRWAFASMLEVTDR